MFTSHFKLILIGLLALCIWSRECCARPSESTTTEDTMLPNFSSDEEIDADIHIEQDDYPEIDHKSLATDYEHEYDIIEYNASTHSSLIHSTEDD